MCLKTALCTNKLEVNCTELADLGEHDSFAKNGSRSARYLEIDPIKRMRQCEIPAPQKEGETKKKKKGEKQK